MPAKNISGIIVKMMKFDEWSFFFAQMPGKGKLAAKTGRFTRVPPKASCIFTDHAGGKQFTA